MAFYKRKIALFFVFFTLTFAFSLGIPEPRSIEERRTLASVLPERIDFWTECDNDVLAQALVDRMSNEELLAQIYMFGWSGSEPGELVLNWIRLRSIGSLKVYGWGTNNVEDVARSVATVQQEAEKTRFKIPLYIATDQEGGWIRHIKGDTSDTPGNLAIGASGELQDAYYSGFYIAKELRAMGQIVSGYLDFAERQAEREQVMTMKDWAAHLDNILTMSGEKLLSDNGAISHEQAMEKAENEYKKYKERTLSDVEKDYLESIELLGKIKD